MFIGKRPALLAVDLYKLAFQGGSKPIESLIKDFPSSCGINAWDAIEPTKKLFELIRTYGFPVIYTTNSTAVRATNRKNNKISNDAYEIWEDFKPIDGDAIIYKERASGFFGTTLISYLLQKKVDSLIVCGQTTSGCVRATVVDAYSYGFHTVLAEECCFDRSILSHKVNLFDMHHKYADVMHLEEIRNHLKKVNIS